jgi:hypothetical protein
VHDTYCTCFQVASEHVGRTLRIAILGRRLDLVFEEMSEVGDLCIGQIGLMIRQLLQGRPDLIAQAVAQNQRRTKEIGTLLGAFRQRSVTVDAELRVHALAPIRARRVHLLSLIGPGLAPQTPTTKRTQRQAN